MSSNPAEKSPPANLPVGFLCPPKVGLPKEDPSPKAAFFTTVVFVSVFFSSWPSSKPYPTNSSSLSLTYTISLFSFTVP